MNETNRTSAARYQFQTVAEGDVFAQEYEISPDVYAGFLATFDDRSPVHVDDKYARDAGFPRRVMHGALLNGFLSHFVGMRFPGATALLLSAELRYLQPSFLGDQLRLELTVTQKLESRRVLSCKVVFRNLSQAVVVANGRIQVAMRVP